MKIDPAANRLIRKAHIFEFLSDARLAVILRLR